VDIADEPWNADPDAVLAATGLEPARTWDVSAICVRQTVRGQTALFAAAIYHGMIKAMQANRVQGFLAMLDVRVGRILNMLGVVLHPLPGIDTRPFWGSPATSPSYAHLDSLLSWQRTAAPDAYRLVTLGVGLDGIRVPGLESFRLQRPRSVQLIEPRRPAPSTIDLSDSMSDSTPGTAAGTAAGSSRRQGTERDPR
jgi:hypothetical protein